MLRAWFHLSQLAVRFHVIDRYMRFLKDPVTAHMISLMLFVLFLFQVLQITSMTLEKLITKEHIKYSMKLIIQYVQTVN